MNKVSDDFKANGFIPDPSAYYNCCDMTYANNINYLQSMVLGNRFGEFIEFITNEKFETQRKEVNSNGHNALILAIRNNRNEFVNLLLDDIFQLDINKSTLLMHAAQCNNIYVVRKIINYLNVDQFANEIKKINNFGTRLLSYCNKKDEITNLLFEKAPNELINYCVKKGDTLTKLIINNFQKRLNEHEIIKQTYLDTKSGPLGNILKFI